MQRRASEAALVSYLLHAGLCCLPANCSLSLGCHSISAKCKTKAQRVEATCPRRQSQGLAEALTHSRALRLCCPKRGPHHKGQGPRIHLCGFVEVSPHCSASLEDVRVCLQLQVLSHSSFDSRSLAFSLGLRLWRWTDLETNPTPAPCDLDQARSSL